MLPGVLTILRLETPNTEGPRLSHHPMWPGVPLHRCVYTCLPGNPKVEFFWYSADLSSKNVFVEAKTYLYVENVFVFLLWAHVVILSDSFGS